MMIGGWFDTVVAVAFAMIMGCEVDTQTRRCSDGKTLELMRNEATGGI